MTTLTNQLIAHTADVSGLDEDTLRANFHAAADAVTAAERACVAGEVDLSTVHTAESALNLARYDLGLHRRQTARAAELGLTLDGYRALLDAEAAEIRAGLARADVA